jgi:hypothetical protein
MNFIKRHFAILLVFVVCLVFFYPTFVKGLAPVPADTIIGLYHPFRDLYVKSYPNGIPFKNFLITDPVRQTYIWKELMVNIWQTGQLPLWNPYEMAGKPLLANFQSGVFYPLNIILFLKPFSTFWSIFILSQSFLCAFFLYLYLTNRKLDNKAAAVGAIAFSFSGFSISWLEWGTILHTVLWLPLLLYFIDRIFENFQNKKGNVAIYVGLLFALSSSFFAGHLQLFFYLFIIFIGYFLLRWFENKKNWVVLFKFKLCIIAFILITFPQWISTLQFLSLSARGIDQNFRSIDGWFLPMRHLIQFLIPDFFGNPSTLNYWGTWNYGELTGYIGVIPLLFASFSLFKKNSTTIFFIIVFLVSLLLALPNVISSIPFILNIPFISTAQPTRLLFLCVFSLCILSAFGFDYFLNLKKISIKHFAPFIFFTILFFLIWGLVINGNLNIFINAQNLLVSKHNLVFPTLIFGLAVFCLLLRNLFRNQLFRKFLIIIVLLLISFDGIRFAQKFTPFTSKSYLYPETKTLKFLSEQKEIFRTAVLDNRVMPPNFFTHYRLQTIEGYDPLYLKSYAEYIVAEERGKADISEPFGFNRIIAPHNYESQLFDFLNTKYILSLDEIKSPKLIKVLEEGQTKIYQNTKAFERAYFVKNVINTTNDISSLFTEDLQTTASISEKNVIEFGNLSVGNVKLISYTENAVSLETTNSGNGFMVMSDTYYPTWKVFVDGKESKIYKTNHAFRGVYIPKGNHFIIFKDYLI